MASLTPLSPKTDTQFKTQAYEDFLMRLGVKHLVTSVEHPRTNSQVEAANKIILKALHTRVDKSKGLWKEELPSILWAYHYSPQTTTNETLYQLIYNKHTMIPVKVRESLTRRLLFLQQQNQENMRVELETTDEVQEMARIREEATKLRASRRYNTKVQPRAFQPDNLEWRVQGEARKDPQAGKFDPNWEGPFRVTTSLDNGAYRLQELDGKAIPRMWNLTHLKFYFS